MLNMPRGPEPSIEETIKRLCETIPPDQITNVLIKAMLSRREHCDLLVREKGSKAGNYNVCYACGEFLSVFKEEYIRIELAKSPFSLILCEGCADRHFDERKALLRSLKQKGEQEGLR